MSLIFLGFFSIVTTGQKQMILQSDRVSPAQGEIKNEPLAHFRNRVFC